MPPPSYLVSKQATQLGCLPATAGSWQLVLCMRCFRLAAEHGARRCVVPWADPPMCACGIPAVASSSMQV